MRLVMNCEPCVSAPGTTGSGGSAGFDSIAECVIEVSAADAAFHPVADADEEVRKSLHRHRCRITSSF